MLNSVWFWKIYIFKFGYSEVETLLVLDILDYDFFFFKLQTHANTHAPTHKQTRLDNDNL